MNQFRHITAQVQHNCTISDSRYAGSYSVCGLALRLRDQYKWEKGLDPWVEKEPAEVLDWIGRKEEAWEGLFDRPFKNLLVFGNTYDPFDTRALNRVLHRHGIYYGAGFGPRLKPTFFLSDIEKETRVNGFSVIILGQERARDLFAAPALTQNRSIIIRKKTAQAIFWDQIAYVKKSGRQALQYALKQYGLDRNDQAALQANLPELTQEMMGAYLYHEIGELSEKVFDRELWREIIGTYPQSPAGLFARAIKDLLADTGEKGTLKYIVSNKKPAALGFYVAFQDGVSTVLFPEIVSAFDAFLEEENWDVIDKAALAGYEKACRLAVQITELFKKGKETSDFEWAEKEITHKLIRPIGL
jgi:hypothetical protein